MEFNLRTCLVGLLVAAFAAPLVAQTPIGEPFTVDTTELGNKGAPDVAIGPDGRFAIAWRAEALDGDGWGVAARWYDSFGTPLTGEVQVNSVAAGSQVFYEIDGDAQGSSVVVWTDPVQGVVVRRFDAGGAPVTDEVVVGSTAEAYSAAVSVNAGGWVLVSWLRAESSTRYVEARRLDADGVPVGEVFTVASFPDGLMTEESVVSLRDDGAFLVVWGDGSEVYGRLFDSAGDPIAAGFQISELDPMSMHSLRLDAGCEDTGRYRAFWMTDINLEESAPMTRTVGRTGALGALTQLVFPSHGLLGFSQAREGSFVVTRDWGWGYELEGAVFDDQQSMLAVFDIAEDPGPGLTMVNGSLAQGGFKSREIVTVWTDDPLPGGPPFPEIKARRFRIGLFADGFESGSTSAWRNTLP